MDKLLAIIKREYIQRVRSRMFLVWTILGPLMLVFFSVVPALVFGIKAGEPTRIAVVDQTGKMYERVSDALMNESVVDKEGEETSESNPSKNINASPQERMRRAGRNMSGSYTIEAVNPNGRSIEAITKELDERVLKNKLD